MKITIEDIKKQLKLVNQLENSTNEIELKKQIDILDNQIIEYNNSKTLKIHRYIGHDYLSHIY